MPRQDQEFSDVVVVVEEDAVSRLDDLATQLKLLGLAIETLDRDNGVIEGTILTLKIKTLETLPAIKYVRGVFNYVSEQCDGDDDNDGDGNDGGELPR